MFDSQEGAVWCIHNVSSILASHLVEMTSYNDEMSQQLSTSLCEALPISSAHV